MNIKETFDMGKKPLLVMGVSLFGADILYTAGHPNFSVAVFPLFLALTAYFANKYSRKNSIGSTAVASVLIANTAIIIEGLVLGILLALSITVNMFPGLTIEAVAISVIEAIVVGVALFSMISALVGAVMWVVVRKIL
jgi:hypothetical protein